MYVSVAHLYEPENKYSKYVQILRQSLFERFKSTVRILGGQYNSNQNIFLRETKKLFIYQVPKQSNREIGVLADPLLAFVFDFSSEMLFKLRTYIADQKDYLGILSICNFFLLVLECITTIVSIINSDKTLYA